MNDKALVKVALRYKALYLDIRKEDINMSSEITPAVYSLLERLKEYGYCVSEELLHGLGMVSVEELTDIVAVIEDVMGVELNWSPLVKGWNVPTKEEAVDHFITWIANILHKEVDIKGTTLPCGHLIPEGTFPLERYNGCPYCGTPFVATDYVFKGQGSKLKELRLFTGKELKEVFQSLLSSPTPLDMTQKNSLELLLDEYDVPEGIEISMKETMMLVIRNLVRKEDGDKATSYLKTPTDILRYLWYEKTGLLQIIKPSVLQANARRLGYQMGMAGDTSLTYQERMKEHLRLKYSRKTCKMVAKWMNATSLSAKKAAEDMNPKRGMWVRFIRALRLAEYAKRKGFEHLAEIMDVFYNKDYTTWQGCIDKASKEMESKKVLNMLKSRPGSFARCLFATMLRFGYEETLEAFEEVADKLSMRLLVSLGNAAEIYFDENSIRSIQTITGLRKTIEHNKLLSLYSREER